MPKAQLPPVRPPVTPFWHSRLLAWPGMLTLLSVLAVLLGHQPHPMDQGPRVTASPVAPTLPEMQPAPQATPGPLLLAAATPEPFRLKNLPAALSVPVPVWTAPTLARSLALLGRRQTDGG
ncbi:hypothetical protein [Deinococcus sp. S9]|uniref:hypothetical protein n=1 Tax=Deinococcus sp. S9 TaxID=2545754 RepID=UPI0010565C2C|nr:hypothetical protein [Deinococcus sp. S9]TDE87241.1 hypothetical protein E0686_01730 [Deinococcus sp. S9]